MSLLKCQFNFLISLFFSLCLSLFISPLMAFAEESACSEFPLAAVNPNPINNPEGAAFPGHRGGNQLVLYTPRYPHASTLTNEYGVEVLVKNQHVLELTGANTPLRKGTFVLSGHGTASRWLLEHANVGAIVQVGADRVRLCQNSEAEATALKSLMQYAKSQGGRLKEWADYLEESKKGMGYYPNPDDMTIPLTSQSFEKNLWTHVAPYYW